MTVGVLALQGCVDPHLEMLKRINAPAMTVRSATDLSKVDRLILPGGESSTMLTLLDRAQLFEPMGEFLRSKPAWGICAGAILLAAEVQNPRQRSFNAIDITATRNFYGSQLDSFSTAISLPDDGPPLLVDFIRAPLLIPRSERVAILSKHGDTPVLMKQDRILVSSFHSELREDPRLHQYFVSM